MCLVYIMYVKKETSVFPYLLSVSMVNCFGRSDKGSLMLCSIIIWALLVNLPVWMRLSKLAVMTFLL